MSVRALARALDLSPSLISQIENGKANPSVGTLTSIVVALKMSFNDAFSAFVDDGHGTSENAETSTLPHGSACLRADERAVLNLAHGVRWERLTPTPDPNVDFLYVVYGVGGDSCPPDELMRHNGREYGLVLSGRLGARVGFETYELDAGDSIVADSTVPHRYWTIGDEPAVVVWAVVGRAREDRGTFVH